MAVYVRQLTVYQLVSVYDMLYVPEFEQNWKRNVANKSVGMIFRILEDKIELP